MADAQTDADLEVQNQQPKEQNEPEGNSIKIRKSFNLAGKTRIIYDISVNDKLPRTFGWRIHEGSPVIVHGSNLEIFNQVNLFISGSVFSVPAVQNSSDGRALSFVVPDDITNLFEAGTTIELAFVDSQNYENNRFLQEKFRYFKQDETKEEQEKKQQKTEQERLNSTNSQPDLTSEIINQTIGAPVTGFVNGLKSNQPSSLKKPTTNKIDVSSKVKKVAKNNNADDNLDDGFEIKDEVDGQVINSVSETVERYDQSVKLVGEYINSNPEVIADTKVRGEILSSLQSGQVGQMSGEAKLALKNVLKLNIQTTPRQVTEQITQAFKVVSQAPELANISETNFTANVGVKTSGQTTQSSQLEADVVNKSANQNISTSSGLGQASQISLSQAREIIGEQISLNPSLIPSAKLRAEVELALQSGNLNSLSLEGKQSLNSAILNISQNGSNINTNQAIKIIDQELKPVDINTEELELPKQTSEKNKTQFKEPELENENKPASTKDNKQDEKNTGQIKSLAGAKILGDLKAKDKAIKQKILGGNLVNTKGLSGLNNKPITQSPSLSTPVKLGKEGNLDIEKNDDQGESATKKNTQTQINEAPLEGKTSEQNDLIEEKEQEIPEPLNSQNLDSENSNLEQQNRNEGEEDEVENESDEDLSDSEQSEQDEQILPQDLSAQKKSPDAVDKTLEAEINLVVTEANIAINTYLVGLITAAWASIFGIPLGAIAGDILLFSESVLKNLIKKKIQYLIRSETIEKEVDKIVDRVKISWAVKINIILMNLVTILAIGIILIGVLVFLKAICSPVKVVSGLPEISGIQSVCNAVNNIPGGNLSDYVNTPASGTIR